MSFRLSIIIKSTDFAERIQRIFIYYTGNAQVTLPLKKRKTKRIWNLNKASGTIVSYFSWLLSTVTATIAQVLLLFHFYISQMIVYFHLKYWKRNCKCTHTIDKWLPKWWICNKLERDKKEKEEEETKLTLLHLFLSFFTWFFFEIYD